MAPYVLCILDGFGLNPNPKGNAVHLAQTPHFDRLFTQCPSSTLTTFGEAVGLPAGQMGNSEVGHLNIGAGRVVEQWLLRIDRELAGAYLSKSREFRNFIANSANSNTIHLIGLYSKGGVHSAHSHLLALLPQLRQRTNAALALHLFTDGRDVSPTAAVEDLGELEQAISDIDNCEIATICGRFYGMDRDRRWERTAAAHSLITTGQSDTPPLLGTGTTIRQCIKESYDRGITDEFLEPQLVTPTTFTRSDSILFWNFRADRMRQIVASLCCTDFKGFNRKVEAIAPERVLCFTQYDRRHGLPVLFEEMEITHHLGQVVSDAGLAQLRTAETEKYPHVTYFFNGGREAPYPGEDRTMIPSPQNVRTYDLKPEMSARQVCQVVTKAIDAGKYDLVVVNFANPDMVGHTGVIEAAVEAVEVVDECLGKIVSTLENKSGKAIITADHGNCDQMLNYNDGSPHTAHTTHPVPLIVYGDRTVADLSNDGALCDVAPTLLELMQIAKPDEMTGRSLLVHNQACLVNQNRQLAE